MKKNNITFALCHQMPERSFHFKGRQFPVCARCTGIFIGYFTLPLFHFGIIHPSFLLLILLATPFLLDSITQTMGLRESNNTLRFITGFLFGAAQVALVVIIGQLLLQIVINY
jgi:uncharacterized membrane protein